METFGLDYFCFLIGSFFGFSDLMSAWIFWSLFFCFYYFFGDDYFYFYLLLSSFAYDFCFTIYAEFFGFYFLLPWSDFISVFWEFFLSFLFGLFLSTTAGSICFLLAESSFLGFPFYFYFPSSTIFYFDLSPVSYLAFDLSFCSNSFVFFPLVSTSFCLSFSLSFYLSFSLFLSFTEEFCLSFLSYSGTPIIFLSLFRIKGLFLFNPRLFLGFPCSLCVYSITGVVVYLIS